MSALTVYTQPATEPVTVAEVLEYLKLDASNQEPPPSAPTVALVATPIAGNVNNGAHRYLVTFVTANGETQAGIASATVTVADKAVNGKVLVSSITLGGSAVTSRKVYRTLAGGSTFYLLATVANNTDTTYTDNIADASLGVGAPSANTTLDPLLCMLVRAARRRAEAKLRRSIITQTLRLYLDGFPSDRITLPRPSLQSVSSIKYTDTDGVEQTLAATEYRVDNFMAPARVEPAYGKSWPATRQQSNTVCIEYVAGYGAAASVPDSVKAWILVAISTAWNNRDQLVVTNGSFQLLRMPNEYVDGIMAEEEVLSFEWDDPAEETWT